MGNGVKVLLVAMLVVSVVVVAKVVNNDTESSPEGAVTPADKKSADKAATSKTSTTSKQSPSKKITLKTPTRKAPSTPLSQRRVAANTNAASVGRVAPHGPVASQSFPARSQGGTGALNQRSGVSPSGTAPAARNSSPAGATTDGSGATKSLAADPTARFGSRESNIVSAEVKSPVFAAGEFSPVAPLKTATGDQSGKSGSDRRDSVALKTAQSPGESVNSRTTAKQTNKKPVASVGPVRSSRGNSNAKSRETASARGFPKKHVVQRGDSYWAVAEKYYKSGTHHGLISKSNGGKKLRPGMKLSIPAPPAPRRRKTSSPASPPTLVSANPGLNLSTISPDRDQPGASRTRARSEKLPESRDGRYVYYVVKKGDTLSGLAVRFLKKGEVHKIKEANRSLLYTSLKAGQRIRIPKS